MGKNENSRMSGNKGEWSELYAFIKLLKEGKVYAADEKVERLDNIYYFQSLFHCIIISEFCTTAWLIIK